MGATTAVGSYAARELKLSNSRGQRRNLRSTAIFLALVFCVPLASGFGQTVFLDFNTVGQYTNNFNPWNDSGGVNGSNYSFMEDSTAGVEGGRGISVFQNTDTTAAYKSGSWDFST